MRLQAFLRRWEVYIRIRKKPDNTYVIQYM